jgi:RNA polymerase sigma factor (sigma-70 family)
MDSNQFKADLIAFLPRLRGHAMALTGSSAAADDLVQDTVFRAWRFRDTFQDGSNMSAWVSKILRNTFYTLATSQRHVVQDVEGAYAARLSCQPEQEWCVKYGELISALQLLTPKARDALLLVVAEGMSYEEAAAVAGCPVGAMKSRVNRARKRLAELTGEHPADTEHPVAKASHARTIERRLPIRRSAKAGVVGSEAHV